MNQIHKFARNAVAAAVVASASIAASAAPIQLGFILDSSGSIGSSGWNLIRSGLANAVNTLIPTTGPDSYYLSVVSFSAGATANISNVLVDDASKAGLVNTIANLPWLNSTTNYAAAFSTMATALSTGANNISTPNFFEASYVNFATDGVQVPNPPTGQAERDALITLGVDNISVEGIGSGVDAVDLQTNFCYPNCTVLPTVNFPAQGFYVAVANADAYAAAINNKIRIITGQVPEPTSLALVGLALLGAGVVRRRAAKV